ncbi:MAG: 1-acyl-sn-glycerol-3-phosphate acyltransferase [Actinomycetota bacterium]|nr:1-acyl-sn-glycerol-3-phosphate acyltransferase [Actinomycetota bacterium]
MGRERPEWAFRFGARTVILFVRSMGWRLDIHGMEHLPPTGGAVLTFNHHSYADWVMSAWPLYVHLGRPVRFLAKQELFERRSVGWLLRGAGQVPVARASRAGRAEAFSAAVERLRGGEVVAVAPEQTISESFELLPFRTGPARMARDAGVPLIPTVNWGTQRFSTKGRRIHLVRRIPVLVRIGEPMQVPGDADLTAVTDQLRATMEEMLHDIQVRYPDEPTPGDDWWVPARLGGSAPPHQEVLRRHREREAQWHGNGDTD